MAQKFRKLDIDLPRQPLSDHRPWEVAGIFLVLLILIFAIFSYLNSRNEAGVFQQQNDNKGESR